MKKGEIFLRDYHGNFHKLDPWMTRNFKKYTQPSLEIKRVAQDPPPTQNPQVESVTPAFPPIQHPRSAQTDLTR